MAQELSAIVDILNEVAQGMVNDRLVDLPLPGTLRFRICVRFDVFDVSGQTANFSIQREGGHAPPVPPPPVIEQPYKVYKVNSNGVVTGHIERQPAVEDFSNKRKEEAEW